MDHVSNAQRALWTFLLFTLAGPFFAALVVAASLILAPAFKLDALMPAGLPPVGPAAVQTFVWAAIPAALAGLAMAVSVWRSGHFGSLAAGVAGVLAVAATAIVLPIAFPELRMACMVLGGLVAVVLRHVLIAARIVLP